MFDINVIKDEEIKAGDLLHWYLDNNGKKIIRKADQKYPTNCYAAEDLNGPDVFLNPLTGAVYNS